MAAKVIAVVNGKGGSTKSNVTCNTSAELAARGHRVVVVDADPQGTTSNAMLGEVLISENRPGTAEVVLDEATASELLRDVPAFGVRLLASSFFRMAHAAKTHLKSLPNSFDVLQRAIATIDDADYILIDTPGDYEEFTRAGCAAANAGLLIPVAAQGKEHISEFHKLLEQLRVLRDGLSRYGYEFPILGIVLNRYREQYRMSREVEEYLRNATGELLLSTRIREFVGLQECVSNQAPIRTLYPGSSGDLDFRALADELVARMDPVHA